MFHTFLFFSFSINFYAPRRELAAAIFKWHVATMTSRGFLTLCYGDGLGANDVVFKKF